MLSEDEILLLQLHKIGSALVENDGDLNRRLKTVMESARKVLHFSRAVLYVFNNEMVEVKVAVGKYSQIGKYFRWPKDTMGGVSYAAATGKAFIQKGLLDKRACKFHPAQKKDRDVLFAIFRLAHLGSGDIALAPIISKGRVVGVLGADKLGKPISRSDLHHLEDFASQAGWAFERADLMYQNKLLLRDLKKALDDRVKEIRTLRDKLVHSERLAAMGELIAGVAHEIKNPLMGIVGFTDLLKEAYAGNEEVKQILSGLGFSVKHLQSVVKNFLSFSKNTKPTLAKMNLNKAVADALALTDHQLKGMRIRVEKKLSSSLPLIKGDHNQLVQVLTNMFVNAAHAMEPKNGGILTIATLYQSPHVLIKITDTGIGISPDLHEKIFQSFFTTKPKGKGTGLGLSISLGIIQRHNGTIKLESVVGKGTTFIISLPAA
jgi:signal transduction histidine kinase